MNFYKANSIYPAWRRW